MKLYICITLTAGCLLMASCSGKDPLYWQSDFDAGAEVGGDTQLPPDAADSAAASDQGMDEAGDTANIGDPEHAQQKGDNPRPDVLGGTVYEQLPLPEGAETEEITPPHPSYPAVCETQHPYEHNETGHICVFRCPEGTSSVTLHFVDFYTEPNYDIVYLFNQQGSLVTLYHGHLGDFWSAPVPGDRVELVFTSDASINDWGFEVDRYVCEQSGPESSPPADGPVAQLQVHYETEHNMTLGAGQDYVDTFIIHQPQAQQIYLHFERLMIDLLCLTGECQVWVKIFDGSDNLIKTYSGSTLETNYWQPQPIAGDTVKIKFEIHTVDIIGGVLAEYGFKINKLLVRGGHPRRFASKYPIVLHHGFGGFDSALGIDYFFRVKHHLERHGFEIYVTEVSPTGTLETRAHQLKGQIDAFLETSTRENGHEVSKVNLIGHSMGGMDPRLLISTNTTGATSSANPKDSVKGLDYGHRLATLTSIASPHWGATTADIALALAPGPAQEVFGALLDFAVSLYNPTQPDENEFATTLYYMTESFWSHLNQDHPEPTDKGTVYRAYCGVAHDPTPILPNSDEIDLPLLFFYNILKQDPDPARRDNDGLVPLWSCQWKPEYYQLYQGDHLHADHLNQVGQLLGITDPDWDHLAFFLYLANQVRVDNENQ